MLPTIGLGPLHVSTYALTYGVAIGLAGMVAFRRLLSTGQKPPWVVEGLGLTVLCGVIGAVLMFAAEAWLWGPRPPGVAFRILGGGSTILGALTGGGLAGLFYCRWRGVSPGRDFDLGIVALPLGQAIGRLGCFSAGCCFGRESDAWLAMSLPGQGGVWAPRYPTQLMSAAADLAIFAVLLSVEQHGKTRAGAAGLWPFPGFLTLLYGLLFLTKRFLMEFARGDGLVVLGPLTAVQLLCSSGLALVVVLLAFNFRRAHRCARSGV